MPKFAIARELEGADELPKEELVPDRRIDAQP
jgi:hypothetical protein